MKKKIAGTVLCLSVSLILLNGGEAQTPEPARAEGIQVVLSGDFPDPTIVRIGNDYYMTHSCGTSLPGLLIWHSTDLGKWERIGYALRKAVGDVWEG